MIRLIAMSKTTPTTLPPCIDLVSDKGSAVVITGRDLVHTTEGFQERNRGGVDHEEVVGVAEAESRSREREREIQEG